MGLIDGAIIGGVIGAVVGGYMTYQLAAWQKKFVAAVDAGDLVGARRILEKSAKAVPKSKSFPMAKLLSQRHRVIGLWLLGDHDGVRAELSIHGGSTSPAYLMNVQMFGLLAQAVEAP